MVLFCADIPVFNFQVILYTLTELKDENVILCVDKNAYEKRNAICYLENLKEQKIFKDIIYMDMIGKNHFLQCKSQEELKKTVLNFYDSQFRNLKYNILDFDKIFVVNDSWDGDMNLYLNYKDIKYTWVETVRNYIDPPIHYIYGNGVLKEEITKLKILSPFAQNAKVILRRDSEESKKILKKEYCTWDVNLAITEIENDILLIILKCFNYVFDINWNIATLFIVNSYGYSLAQSKFSPIMKKIEGFLDYHNEITCSAIFCLALDFYKKEGNDVYFKAHPNDPVSKDNLVKYYGTGGSIDNFPDIPIEFVVEFFKRNKIKLSQILGFASSSFAYLKESGISNNMVILGESFFRTWSYYASLFISLQFCKETNIKDVLAPSYIRSQLNFLASLINFEANFIEYNDVKTLKDYQDSFIFVDSISPLINESLAKDLSLRNILGIINIEVSEDFRLHNILKLAAPIIIEKLPFNSKNEKATFQHDEIIWILTHNNTIRQHARNFTFEKALKYSEIELKVRKHTIQEHINLVNDYLLSQTLSFVEKKMDLLTLQVAHYRKLTFIKYDKNLLIKELCKETNFVFYLDYLFLLKNEFIFFLAVKDTPGDNLTEEELNSLKQLGATNFSKKLWMTYIGVIDGENIICNKIAQEAEHPIDFKYSIISSEEENNSQFYISSQAWRKGNKAEIIIDNIDYCTNLRGINIVVYDKIKKEVIDSIGYDHHYCESSFVRLNLKDKDK